MTDSLALANQDPLSAWEAMRAQAQALVKSGFLPRTVDTAEKAIAIMQTGRELGIGPMQALRNIHIIEGKPTMAAELIAGLVLARVQGATLRVTESTSSLCVVDAARPGQPITTFKWTIEDAQRAGLMNKQNWKGYPRAMLRSRCIAEAARAIFPDATMGMLDPDELGAVTSATGEVIDIEARRSRIAPHIEPHEDPDALPIAGGPFDSLMARLKACSVAAEAAQSYDDVLAVRVEIGTMASQGAIPRDIQRAQEASLVTPDQKKALGKEWARLNRRLVALEKQFAPSLEDSFRDDAEDELGGRD